MQSISIRRGDSYEVLESMEPGSVWAVVCDPPYDLVANKGGGSGTASLNLSTPQGRSRIGVGNGAGGFMGKQWDSTGIAFSVEFWQKAYRVLKPGGVLKTFGGTRTFHKMAKAIEEAGFSDIKMEAWLYSSGFPKSLNISKQIDKLGGKSPRSQAEWLKSKREEMGMSREELADLVGCTTSSIRDWEEGRSRVAGTPLEFMVPSPEYRSKLTDILGYDEDQRKTIGATKNRVGDGSLHSIGHSGVLTSGGNTDLSRKWAGWGTALKPSWEPVIVAKKPL